jgi:hypothetical protein
MIYRLMLACSCASLLAPRVITAQATHSSTTIVKTTSAAVPATGVPVINIAGPIGLIEPVLKKFGVNPVVIDTTDGHRVSLFYVDGPYTRLSAKQQSAQAEAIARFVWSLSARPVRADTVSVSFERPMRTMGESGVTRAFSFDRATFTAK